MLPDGSISILSSMGELLQTINGKSNIVGTEEDKQKLDLHIIKGKWLLQETHNVAMFETVPIYGNASNFVDSKHQSFDLNRLKSKNILTNYQAFHKKIKKL